MWRELGEIEKNAFCKLYLKEKHKEAGIAYEGTGTERKGNGKHEVSLKC